MNTAAIRAPKVILKIIKVVTDLKVIFANTYSQQRFVISQ